MTGTDIIGALLREDPDVIGLIPVDRIKAASLPDGVELPVLLVRTISSVELQVLKRKATTRTFDRVAVAVRAANYRDQKAAIRLVKTCCAGKVGNIGGGQSVSILTAGTGPDLRGPGDSYEQTIDFRVSFDA